MFLLSSWSYMCLTWLFLWFHVPPLWFSKSHAVFILLYCSTPKMKGSTPIHINLNLLRNMNNLLFLLNKNSSHLPLDPLGDVTPLSDFDLILGRTSIILPYMNNMISISTRTSCTSIVSHINPFMFYFPTYTSWQVDYYICHF